MTNQTSILNDAELDQVVGGNVDRPVFRTVLDMSAAASQTGNSKARGSTSLPDFVDPPNASRMLR